jgi:hypothetical protein
MSNTTADVLITISILLFIVIMAYKPFKKKEKNGLIFTLYFNSITIKSSKMKFTIQKSKFPVKGSITPTADNGQLEGVETVNYSSDNTGAVTVGPDPAEPDNTRKFQLDFGGTLGKANVGASADADLTAGVKTLTDNLEITVIEDEATKLNMNLEGLQPDA